MNFLTKIIRTIPDTKIPTSTRSAFSSTFNSFFKKKMSTDSKVELSRQNIADMIAEEHKLSNAKADRIVKGVFDAISENVMEKKKVSIAGFGTFSNVHVHARMGRNPGTGEQISISARQRVKFSPFKALKDAANGK